MTNEVTLDFIKSIPKAELHVHLTGTLEPSLMLKLAEKNKISIPYKTIEDAENAYNFSNLSDFLKIYDAGAKVLSTGEDYYELTKEYLFRAKQDGVVHTEMFFEQPANTSLSVQEALDGVLTALRECKATYNISSNLILCFLRNLPEKVFIDLLSSLTPYANDFVAVGLAANELGNPPSLFKDVYNDAGHYNLHKTAHAGEEGPPEYIWEALNILNVSRIDHGVRCEEDEVLMRHLLETQTPLTVCPVSNVKLKVFPSMEHHNVKRLLDYGLKVTINSDDPAYFRSYIADNFLQAALALNMTKDDVVKLCQNSLDSRFTKN
jgi:adenosine deaminase